MSDIRPTHNAPPPAQRSDIDLMQSRRALHLVISSLPHLLLQISVQDEITAFFIPPGFPAILNAQELETGQPLINVIPATFWAAVEAALAEVRAAGKVITLEEACSVEDEALYFEIKVAPVIDSADVLITMNDITRRMRAEMAEREQRIFAEALVDTATALNSTIELDEVLDQILASLHRVIPHDRGNIMMIEQGFARVVRCRGYDDPDEQAQITRMRLVIADVPNLALMLESQQPLLVLDTSEHPDWLTITGNQWEGAYAGVPITGGSEIIGFINLESATAGAFSTADRARLRAFADQAAIALNNARLFRQLQTRNAELDAFTHTVAHDLKTPLQTIMGYATLLGMKIGKERAAEIDEYLEAIDGRVRTMGRIIESLLLLATVRDSAETMHTVDVSPVIHAAVTRFETEIARKGIEVVVADDIPPLLGYGPWLEEVFANLISNAVKYIDATPQNVPRIEIRGWDMGDGWVRCEVRDNGPGIDIRDQARLFNMFTRFHTKQASGHGLGLSIVQRIIVKLGGTLGVESMPNQGSTFWFTLPAA